MEDKPKNESFTDEEFLRVKETAEIFYKTVPEVYCPYFKEKINLNAKGLDHIKFKSWQKARTRADQFMRLKSLRLIPEILTNSKTLQGVCHTNILEKKKINSRWENRLCEVSYYEFIAVIEKKRIKIIVKQIEGGEKHFWTIIPYWKMDNFNRRVLHEGDPEND